MVERGSRKNRASFSEATVAARVGGAFKVLARKRGESRRRKESCRAAFHERTHLDVIRA